MTNDAAEVRGRPHPDTSTIFVLGLLGLGLGFLGSPVALVFALCAWIFGTRLLHKYDAEPGRWGRRSLAEAGRILGIVGTAMSLLWLVLLLLSVAL